MMHAQTAPAYSSTRQAAVPPAARSSAGAHHPARPFSSATGTAHRPPRQRRSTQRLCVRASAAEGTSSSLAAPIPTRLNTIPHERSTRQYFYRDAVSGVLSAVAAGETRMVARCTIPELNTEFDVYRIGTLLEMVRELATALAADGRTVKVCVQQALGQGVFQGMPLSLNGVMRIMNQMDWGEVKDRIQLGNLGAAEVDSADAFVLISPQNIVGHSVLPLLGEMAEAAGAAGKPMILINPKLGDIQSAGGVMSVRGRQDRLDFTSTFVTAYHFRLLYKGVMMHPIMGALRHTYGGPWEVFRRVELGPGKEEYQLIASFESEPKSPQITDAFRAAWAKAASC